MRLIWELSVGVDLSILIDVRKPGLKVGGTIPTFSWTT